MEKCFACVAGGGWGRGGAADLAAAAAAAAAAGDGTPGGMGGAAAAAAAFPDRSRWPGNIWAEAQSCTAVFTVMQHTMSE